MFNTFSINFQVFFQKLLMKEMLSDENIFFLQKIKMHSKYWNISYAVSGSTTENKACDRNQTKHHRILMGKHNDAFDWTKQRELFTNWISNEIDTLSKPTASIYTFFSTQNSWCHDFAQLKQNEEELPPLIWTIKIFQNDSI